MLQENSISIRQVIQIQRQKITLQRKLQTAVQHHKTTLFTFKQKKLRRNHCICLIHKKNESMINAITYIAPKNKTMAHSMILNNRISCVLGISIFGFKKYWQTIFNLMDLNMSPTLKTFLQYKTVNARKNKSYYQRYYVKIMRASHKQAIMKQRIYKNIIERQSRMDYSPGICFETILVNMYKAKALTKINQPEKSNQKQQIRCRYGSIKYLWII